VIRSYGSFILLFTPKTGLIEHFSKKMPNQELFPVGHFAFLEHFPTTNRWNYGGYRWICGVIVRLMELSLDLWGVSLELWVIVGFVGYRWTCGIKGL